MIEFSSDNLGQFGNKVPSNDAARWQTSRKAEIDLRSWMPS